MSKIIYTDKMEDWKGAYIKYPIFPFFGLGTCKIYIKTKYLQDEGLLLHELEHEKQYKKDWFHAFKYKFNRSYRLECELSAYEKQIEKYGYSNIRQCGWIVDALVNKYDLKVSVKHTIKKIEEILNRKGKE